MPAQISIARRAFNCMPFKASSEAADTCFLHQYLRVCMKHCGAVAVVQHPAVLSTNPGVGPHTWMRAADASVAPLRISIAGLTDARLPVLLGRCVALLERCKAPGLACSSGCRRGSACVPGAAGDGLPPVVGAPPPSLLFLRGCNIYCDIICWTASAAAALAGAYCKMI